MSRELDAYERDLSNEEVEELGLEDFIKNIKRFEVKDDSKAEWTLLKIREEEADTKRLINLCEEKISEYQMKIKQFKKQCENKTSFFKAALHGYFLTVPHKKTKAQTQETYKLPSGKLKLKFKAPELAYEEEKLVEWAEDHNRSELVKETKKVDWKTLKGEIKVVGNSVIAVDGEAISEITVLKRDPEFIVEVE